MRNGLLAGSLLLVSSLTHAGPYVGLGYQFSSLSIEDDDLQRPVVDGRPIDLSGSESDDNFKLLAGYTFGQNWGLELAYHELEISNGVDVVLSATEEEEWEASVDGTHITLAPFYRHELSERFDARAIAGIVYGDYDVRQSHVVDVENGPDRPISRSSRSETEFGGLIGVGLIYEAPWNIDLTAEYQYSQTSLVSSSALSLTASYRF